MTGLRCRPYITECAENTRTKTTKNKKNTHSSFMIHVTDVNDKLLLVCLTSAQH